MIKEILLLGDTRLYQTSQTVKRHDDHLGGILATMRAIDNRAFYAR